MRAHFVGIGGIAMSAVAGLAKELGFEVSGSEVNPIYPPANLILRDLKIDVWKSDEKNIDILDPQIVIVGNAVKGENAEVKKAKSLGKEILSFPQFIEKYILPNRVSLVVAGTHGKTTTSALLAWSLLHLSEDPTYVVGGLLRETEKNYRYGKGKYLVLEGDEYPSAFFDHDSKFLHYHPFGLILTSLEYDHVDVFPNFDALISVFENLIKSVHRDGILVYCSDDTNLRKLIDGKSLSVKRKFSYGMQSKDYRLVKSSTIFNGKTFHTEALVADPSGTLFTLKHNLPGFYNSLNVLGVFALLEVLGFQREEITKAIEAFSGVKRRQEILYRGNNCLVIDDFAHHPSAVKVTLISLIEAYKPEVTSVVFEPRTNSSKRRVFQDEYISALSLANEVYLKEPPGIENIPESERVDLSFIVTELKKRGVRAKLCGSLEDFSLNIYPEKRQLIVFMSSAYMEKEIEMMADLLRRANVI